ncbi:uncharacterized protein LOC116265928 isoform X2 [Nymphaea colorata]|nr:uncharacterized protein LOC116265928 isoform X2 [Nymphaea colorata]
MAEIDGGTWWWAVAGSAQLVAGLAAYRRGSGGSSTMMPFKAFGVASLFVGSASCAVAGVVHASGIRQVDDLKRLGQSIRSKLGVPPRSSSNGGQAI